MKKIFEFWWRNGTKVFQIINYRKAWKECGNKPRVFLHENGGRRKKGDTCFDISLILGYTVLNYTNFDLQRLRGGAKMFTKNKNKKTNQKMSTYPCVNFLHNALRFVLENEIDVAYTEICYAIIKSGAELTETEKAEFDKRNTIQLRKEGGGAE